jgi:hypothetical protein
MSQITLLSILTVAQCGGGTPSYSTQRSPDSSGASTKNWDPVNWPQLLGTQAIQLAPGAQLASAALVRVVPFECDMTARLTPRRSAAMCTGHPLRFTIYL